MAILEALLTLVHMNSVESCGYLAVHGTVLLANTVTFPNDDDIKGVFVQDETVLLLSLIVSTDTDRQRETQTYTRTHQLMILTPLAPCIVFLIGSYK